VHAVHDQVLGFIEAPEGDRFGALALAVFAHQFERCDAYRHFCERRSRTPDTVLDWRSIPAVPIEAFKHAELWCAEPERTFLSTGTTRGLERRSHHGLPDLRLYRASAVAGLRSFLCPDCERVRIVSLIPSARTKPESSLAQMVDWAIEEFGNGESTHAVGEDAAPDLPRCAELLRTCERSGRPCCLLATTAGLIRLIEWAGTRAGPFRLPHGSRIMDTGGDKGVARPLSRNGLLHACWNVFAVPGYYVVNEYGMTELSSQLYDNVVAERFAGRFRPRFKCGPPWIRTSILDPASLAPVEPGETGLLCHFDLANAGTVMAVLSEDLGRPAGDGFEIIGRARGAEARGCSLALDEWAPGGTAAPAGAR
jgi:hypothetical protein